MFQIKTNAGCTNKIDLCSTFSSYLNFDSSFQCPHTDKSTDALLWENITFLPHR